MSKKTGRWQTDGQLSLLEFLESVESTELLDNGSNACEKCVSSIPGDLYYAAEQLVIAREKFATGYLQARLHISACMEDRICSRLMDNGIINADGVWMGKKRPAWRR